MKTTLIHDMEVEIERLQKINGELLEACKAMKEFIGNAVRFINDGAPPIPDTEQAAISEKYQMLFRVIDKAEGRP